MIEARELAERYADLVATWGAESNSTKANRLFDRIHALAVELRRSGNGRRELEKLLTSENRAIRYKSASDCLAWDCKDAIVALEGLVEPRGPYSLDAEMTLREYRAGQMKFDW
ncbi:DUF2019 domain-containing protein [Microbacterium kyungheense]|uniref:Uncharacterized protein DUF2019 n=1 Tax=Microbacterium kyungheense TaxID=1263636 RepID=A0A543FIQ4_9MICO|nr:DUF2019 domain-containing protein [Microbacterium kyungheense]TQM33747.1 uncharacterized protein DUF2019 [Microbacterium kyungheense]